ncbi:MAG: hypothetical protein AAFR21_00590 [Pseudomonadota bacterium]
MKSGPRQSLTASIAIAVLFVVPAIAAPWTRPQGDIFVETRVDYFRVNPQTDFRFERLETNQYLEVGVFPQVMIGGKLSYGQTWVTDGGTSFSASGVSEFEGFVQHTVLQNSTGVVSVKASGAIPRSIDAGVRTGLSNDGPDAELRLLGGFDIKPLPWKLFVTGETAYRRRFGNGSDEVRLDGLIGVQPSEQWLFLGEAMGSFAVGNAEDGGADYDVVRLVPSAIYRLSSRYSLRAGASFEVATRNLDPGRRVFIGLWAEF